MNKHRVSLFLFMLVVNGMQAQPVNLRSFQHTVRWVNEANFPALVKQESVRDSLLQVAADVLREHFNVEKVGLPPTVDYNYISGFGKDKIREPSGDETTGQTAVYIHTFITRATTGFAVNCRMNALAVKDGQTVYTKETEHELEYFSPTGYLSNLPWYDETAFIDLYRELLGELFSIRELMPAKVKVGSLEMIETSVVKQMGDPERMILNTAGDFLHGNNFAFNLRAGEDTVARVSYYNGWDLSLPKVEINMSRLGAELFKSVTHIDFGYRAHSREIRYGRLEHAGGRVTKLRMEWMQEETRYTDGSGGVSYATSPMEMDAYENDQLIAYATYHAEMKGDAPTMKELMSMKQPTQSRTFWLEGMIRGEKFVSGYDPTTALLTVSKDGRPKLIVIMMTMDSANGGFSNMTLSKNKRFVTSSYKTVGKPSFRKPESYFLYCQKGMAEADLLKYLDTILLLFFGVGK
jgi:hypothetical protein